MTLREMIATIDFEYVDPEVYMLPEACPPQRDSRMTIVDDPMVKFDESSEVFARIGEVIAYLRVHQVPDGEYVIRGSSYDHPDLNRNDTYFPCIRVGGGKMWLFIRRDEALFYGLDFAERGDEDFIGRLTFVLDSEVAKERNANTAWTDYDPGERK